MRVSIAYKILFGFALVLFAFLCVIGYSVYKMQNVRDRLVLIGDTYVPITQVLSQASSLEDREEEWLKGLEDDSRLLQIGFLKNSKKITDHLERARLLLESASDPASRSDEDILSNAQKRLADVRVEAEDYMKRRSQIEQRILARQLVPPDQIRSLRLSLQKLGAKLNELSRYMQWRIRYAAERAEETERNSLLAISLLALLALGIGVAVSVLANLTLKPLSELASSAREAAKGEFSGKIALSSQDEVGDLANEFNSMLASLEARDKLVKEKTQELTALMRFHSDIIRSLSTGLIVLDHDGNVRGLNPAALSLWGLSLSQSQGSKISSLPVLTALPLEHQERLFLDIQRVLLSEEKLPVLLRALKYPLAGKDLYIDLRVVPFFDAEGEIEGVLLLGDDVTEEQRTKERLLQSERLATVGRMAAQVAHEIRNPLSSIGLNTELLEDDLGDSPEGRRLLHAIQGEVERLTAITEEYLRYARFPQAQRTKGDLRRLLQSIVDFLRLEAESRNVTLSLFLPEALPTLWIDEAQLRQALLNVLRNAFEALGLEGGHVSISVAENLAQVEVAITDSGPGVSAEVQARIFEPFFSTKSGGTGLGLALSLQIAEAHGGTLRIDSQHEQGARFVFVLSRDTDKQNI